MSQILDYPKQHSAFFKPAVSRSMKAASILVLIGLLAHAPQLYSKTEHDKDTSPEAGLFVSSYHSAATYDPRMRSAYHQFDVEREELPIADSAMLPDVRLSGSYRHERSDNIYTDPDSNFYDPEMPRSSGDLTDTHLRLSISQPLYDRSLLAEQRRARAHLDAAQYDLKRAEQELVHRTTEALLDAIHLSQQVHLHQARLDALEMRNRQVQRQYELGVGDQLDILEVQAHRDIAHAELLEAKSQRRDALRRVENITGSPPTIPQAWIRNAHLVKANFELQSEEYWLAQLANNLDYRAMQSIIEQRRASVVTSKAGHYPTVSLTLSHDERSSKDEFRDRSDSVISLDVMVPIYQGGRVSAQVRRATAQLKAEQARKDDFASELYQEVELKYLQLSDLAGRMRAISQSIQSTERYLAAAERGEGLGLRSQLDILDARSRLVDSQLQYAKALSDYLKADLAIHLHIGALSPERLAEYDQLFAELSNSEG